MIAEFEKSYGPDKSRLSSVAAGQAIVAEVTAALEADRLDMLAFCGSGA